MVSVGPKRHALFDIGLNRRLRGLRNGMLIDTTADGLLDSRLISCEAQFLPGARRYGLPQEVVEAW